MKNNLKLINRILDYRGLGFGVWGLGFGLAMYIYIQPSIFELPGHPLFGTKIEIWVDILDSWGMQIGHLLVVKNGD